MVLFLRVEASCQKTFLNRRRSIEFAEGEKKTTVKFLTFDCYGTLIDWKEGIETNFSEFFPGDALSIDAKQHIFEKYVSLEAQEEGGSNAMPTRVTSRF